MRVATAALSTLLSAAGVLAACIAPSAASAADLRVQVTTPAGAPVVNAVVSAYPSAGDYKARPSATPLAMSQKDIAFLPYVLIAPVGSTIEFPNRDNVRHHVYSFSPIHRFELKLYGKEEKRTEVFDKVGVVPLGCNIHDKMAGYIDVVDTRFAAKTDAQGVALIPDVPAGAVRLKVWHPLSKNAAGATATGVAGAAIAPVVMDLRPSPPGKQSG